MFSSESDIKKPNQWSQIFRDKQLRSYSNYRECAMSIWISRLKWVSLSECLLMLISKEVESIGVPLIRGGQRWVKKLSDGGKLYTLSNKKEIIMYDFILIVFEN